MRPQSTATPASPLGALSRLLGHLRWAFMPLGLLALVAVGVHAAADTVDERLLSLVDWLDSAFDGLVGRWSVTEPLVEWVSLERRTVIARVLALAWELAADVVLALPALGYEEVEARPAQAWRGALEAPAPTWRALLARCVRRPTTMRWVRPLATAAVVVAGACTVALSVQGTVYLSWRELLGERASDVAARGLALGTLVGLLATLGWRAVLRNLQHADAACEALGWRWETALSRGLPGSSLVVPLALAAVLDASPVLSFLR